MSRTTGFGVPCAKCGETVFVYPHETAPKLTDIVDVRRFTYAVGEKKGKTVMPWHDGSLCPNGCKWTQAERAQTFNPRFWNEIRTDG